MNILSRDFTTKEKAILIILVLILLALGYYQFVDQPVRRGIMEANAERDALQLELNAVQARVEKLEGMQAELNGINTSTATYMPSYNNSEAELEFLNSILQGTQYALNMKDPTRDGDQVRRSFSLEFTTESVERVQKVLSDLGQCRYRCLIDDLSCSRVVGRDNVSYGYHVSATATFYETMVGGTPDAGLPAASEAS